MKIKNLLFYTIILLYANKFLASNAEQNNIPLYQKIKDIIKSKTRRIFNFFKRHKIPIITGAAVTSAYFLDKYKNNGAILNALDYHAFKPRKILKDLSIFNVTMITTMPIASFLAIKKIMDDSLNQNKSKDFIKINEEDVNNIFLNIEEYKEIIERYKNKINANKIYKNLNINFPEKSNRHALISGKPGTGKTFLIKHLAKLVFPKEDYTVYYKNINLGSVKNIWVGSEVKNIKKLQTEIEELHNKFINNDETGRLIIILQFDEAESLFPKRDSDAHGNQKKVVEDITNSFLTMIDKYNEEKKYDVIFMLTTNYPENIDDAIKRSGRIENQWELELPNTKTKEDYLNWYIGIICKDASACITLEKDLKNKIIRESNTFTDIIKRLRDHLDRYMVELEKYKMPGHHSKENKFIIELK